VELSLNNFCRGKSISITYSECVYVALVIQHAKRMRRIKLSAVACLAVPFTFTYLINGKNFVKMFLSIKYLFWFPLQLLFEIFLILRRIQRDIVICVHMSLCKVPIILVTF
jgi:hypothetical protein